MTREESIKALETLLLRADMTDEYGDVEDMTPYEDAVDVAIQAIQALDDIRAEIKELPYQRIFGSVSSYSLLDTVIEIIDKHISGEEQERSE